MKNPLIFAVASTLLGAAALGAHAQNTPPAFKVRPGYELSVVAQGINGLRFMEFGADANTLYVSNSRAGSISTLKRQPNGTFKPLADFTTNKPSVHGMQFVNGWLWFTQSGAIWKGRDTNGDGKADEEIKVTEDLPNGGGHWWRSILVDGDSFYTSIGDASNASEQNDTDRQKVWKYSLDGKTKTLWSTGIRNTEKLRLRPGTHEVWGADHGSDNFGKSLGESGGNQPVTDRIPPCEFNRYDQGGFYGHPYIVGTGEPRPEYANRPDILELAAKNIMPKWPLGAHWAPNGWTFATKNTIAAPGDAYIACHGSWNSSKKVGYCVEHVIFDSVTGEPQGANTLVSMLASDGRVLDRPVDVVEAADGSLLVSADSGNIYRITRARGN